MDIAAKGAHPYADSLVNEIKRLDLSEHVMELEAYGFTVIPPSKTGITDDWVARLRNAILRTVERRGGVDLSDWETRETEIPVAQNLRTWELLPEDDVFAEAALQPAGLAMARWLCGQTVSMVGHTLIAKGPTPADRPWTQVLHNDLHGVPGGGDICHGCNVSILATDYASTDDGPTILAPGTHHFARAPSPEDMQRPCLPLEGEAGSIAVWNDFTWHGAMPRKNAGLRLTLVQQYMRPYMRPLQMWREEDLAPGQLERYPELRKVLGLDHPYPFHQEIEKTGEFVWFMGAGTNRFA